MILDYGFKYIYDNLTRKGYKAYAVGGAVRDSLMRREYSDIDVTTDALPVQVMEIFKRHTLIKQGIKHGTVGVVVDKKVYEITTFRAEGGYTDYRHPDKVRFEKDLKKDLSRRDFTINALAYNESEGVVDYFGGQADIKDGIIRAVEDEKVRFKEDALRIMRALRFSSQLGFSIHSDTAKAMFADKELLNKISVERLYSELIKTLMGDNVESVLLTYRDIFAVIIPQLKEGFDFDQKSIYHAYTVYDHIVKSVGYSVKDKTVRLALLLHDIGKPRCFSIDENGRGHFYGHQKFSVDIAKEVLEKFKCDNKTKSDVLRLVNYHDYIVGESKAGVKKILYVLGDRLFSKLLQVQRADSLAHSEIGVTKRLEHLKKVESYYNQVRANGECYTLKRLAVNGQDIINLGYSGEQVGQILKGILSDVIADKLPNDKNEILKSIGKR